MGPLLEPIRLWILSALGVGMVAFGVADSTAVASTDAAEVAHLCSTAAVESNLQGGFRGGRLPRGLGVSTGAAVVVVFTVAAVAGHR